VLRRPPETAGSNTWVINLTRITHILTAMFAAGVGAACTSGRLIRARTWKPTALGDVETTLMLVRIWNAADFRYGRAPEGSPPSNTFRQRRHVR
jgi:hypothetical protein